MNATLTGSATRSCAVVTLADKLSRALAQGFRHPPSILGCDSAHLGKQQALREEQRQDRHGPVQLVEHISDARGPGPKTRAYRMATAPPEPSGKNRNSLVGLRPRRTNSEQQH